MREDAILEVKGLSKFFPIRSGLTQKHVGDLKAVNDISFYVKKNEVLGMVGESGCGKTTAGRTILRLKEPTAGEILFRKEDNSVVDIAKLDKRDLKEIRKEIRMIFQDPFSSLNPRFTVKDIIGEPLKIHNVGTKKEREDRLVELMKSVGLNPSLMNRYPHEFSGGQRQRIGIARTLALNPRMIIADEPVSALDVSVQAQVLNLIQDLKVDFGLTLIFVAHDLSVIEHISDRILVMYIGNLFELGSTEEMLSHPLHPYTEALISAVPSADPRIKMNKTLMEGDVPSPVNPPSGCVFHPRCRYAQEKCKTHVPEFKEVSPGRFCRCHFAGELTLKGIGGLNG